MERIAIVGGGVAGLATAYFLARNGVRDVVLLERENVLGAHASGRNAGILRTAIGDGVLRELGLEGARFLWDPPDGFCDVPLVDRCGLVLAAREGEEQRLEAWSGSSGVRAQDSSGLASHAPHLSRDFRRGLLVPDEGRIDIEALLAGFARGAERGGVSIQTGARVESLLTERGAVCGVALEGGEELRARWTVLASGGWAGALGAGAGSALQLFPTRRHLLVSAPAESVDPRWPVVWTVDERFYARPAQGGLMLCSCDEVPVDPDRCENDPRIAEEIAERTARYLPDLDLSLETPRAAFWCAMRTFSQDRRFAVGPDAEVPGLFWVAGLGGHGVVCSPAIGRIACEWLSLGRAPSDPLSSALDPARFAASRASR
jgi:glycine/D-amino acid oxidase-like deaminating enzyme